MDIIAVLLIQITNKMLRKNIKTPSCQPSLPNTIATQTQDFLVYLPLEQKLSTILEEYHNLQSQYKHSQDMLEYYEFKNNILENSLHQLTFALQNKLSQSKIKLCDDIVELEKAIEKEKMEADCLERITISRVEAESSIKSKQSSRNSQRVQKKQSLSSRKKQSQRAISYRKYRQIQRQSSVKSEQKAGNRSEEQELNSSQNEFLQVPNKVLIGLPAKNQNTAIECGNNKLTLIKSQTERKKVKKQGLKETKSKIQDKQNNYVDVMIKRQAELNLKRFLKDFNSINLDFKSRPIH